MREIDKKAIPTKLLWVDLEMTGLNADEDVILEVSAIVTNFEFDIIGQYDAIISQPEEKLSTMNEWAAAQHASSGLTERVRTEGRPEAEVVSELVTFVQGHFGEEPAILSGNSIHNDRVFIRRWWPEVDELLHYRMLDVSAWKVFMQGRYGLEFEKEGSHRAADDIKASIAELQYYLECFSDEGSLENDDDEE